MPLLADSSSMPLRERRRKATRRDVERAAAELFELQGYEATTVEQIAKRAGVSMRTFYRYCRSKDEAITFELGSGPAQLLARIQNHGERPLVEAVIEGFVESVSMNDGDLEWHRRLLRVIVDTAPLRTAWLGAGRAAQDVLAAEFSARRPQLDRIAAAALAAATTATLTVAIEAWARGEQPTIQDATRASIQVIASALAD
ncbi:helix-turn-helix domain-containing protein [Curtobacterium sp. A7_M15]|uniref:TetR/AcrR family transcriptional regulator n=1 Tax=Curtobacterium sp. A7_M15 TaxID=3065241 RepID=UPI002737F1B3|nr:TetR/AcrR family transcriptional regulator [Curtobacterium sp. A7_M15]MDP4332009.1 helix-turn-helix domain-containing protein [Curtobacterium sp. A7_M15]